MKVCNITRDGVYSLLAQSFARLGIRPRIVELGVLHGDNAHSLRTSLAPRLTVIVESWRSSGMDGYRKVNSHRGWVEPLEVHEACFGGNPFEPATHEANYQAVRKRVSAADDVTILRMDTMEALSELQVLSEDQDFDLIYIDANHQYEAVLDDLLCYRSLVSHHGVLMLNACCHSESGERQNLGVLEAACRFIKMSGLTNTDFSDLVLAPAGSLMINAFDHVATQGPIGFVDVPRQLLASARVLTTHCRMSFV